MSWRRFFRRAHWDRERAEELKSYLDIETEENIGRGMSPAEARRAAHRKLGNTVRIREEIYRMNTIGVLDSLGRDLRYALRGMGRHPTFTLAVVLTLALGLGANTAIFAVVDGVLIKPLPYPNPQELVSLRHVAPGINVDDFLMSPTQYFTYREEGRVFQDLGVWLAGGTTITGNGDPEQARMVAVTHGVLLALGIQPAVGRIFTEADTTTGTPGLEVGGGAVILTYGYWQRRFGGDPSVIGRQLTVDSRPAEIVGVMPEGFRFLDMKPQAEVILPIRINRNSVALDGFNLRGLARLKSGATVAEANADIARMLPIWLNAWPIPPGTLGRQAIESWRITPALQPSKDEVVGGVGEMLWVLMGTIGIVLLIACANVANLMLVRFDGRRQEFCRADGARRQAWADRTGSSDRRPRARARRRSTRRGSGASWLEGTVGDGARLVAAAGGDLARSPRGRLRRRNLVRLESAVCRNSCLQAQVADRLYRPRCERQPRATENAQCAGCGAGGARARPAHQLGADDPHVPGPPERRPWICRRRHASDRESLDPTATSTGSGAFHPDAARDSGPDRVAAWRACRGFRQFGADGAEPHGTERHLGRGPRA
jgi:hypothetical protein